MAEPDPIERLLGRLNWRKVRVAMLATGHRWCQPDPGGQPRRFVPTIAQLREAARKLLVALRDSEEYRVRAGGFVACRLGRWWSLSFEVEAVSVEEPLTPDRPKCNP